jgi:hypothetical protein
MINRKQILYYILQSMNLLNIKQQLLTKDKLRRRCLSLRKQVQWIKLKTG